MVKILDCTVRDGGYKTNWTFTDNFIKSFIQCLEDSKVDYFEIGYRNFYDTEGKGKFYKCGKELLQQYYNEKKSIQIGIMTDTKRFNSIDFPGAEHDYTDFVRVAGHPDKIRETLDIAKSLLDKNYRVFVQLMEISNVEKKDYDILAKWDYKNEIECIYMADSYGTITPSDVESFYKIIQSNGYNKIGFHAHNTINLALENTLKAIELGAYCVDVTLSGLGRGSGNLDAVELFNNISGYNPKFYEQIKL